MDSFEKEMLCTHCSHVKVCSYKTQFLSAQKAVENVSVGLGDCSCIYLRDIKWIQPVELRCDYYTPQEVVR